MKKTLLIILPLLLIVGCSKPVPDKQKIFTDTWKTIKKEYNNATTSSKKNSWLNKGVNHLKNNKSEVNNWYGKVIDISSNSYLTVGQNNIKYYLLTKGRQSGRFSNLDVGDEVLFSGYLNGEKSWTNAGAIDEPEMNVTLYQLTSTDLSANYFKTTLTAPPGPTDNYRNLANEKSVYFDCGFTIWLKPDGTWYHKIHGVSGFSSNKGPYKIVNSREISLGGNDYIKWDDNGVRCLKWGKIRNNNCCQ